MKLDARTFADYLAGLQAEFEAGVPNALINAVWASVDQREPVPEWAAEPFLRALSKWKGGHVATLDEALGFVPMTLDKARTQKRTRVEMIRVMQQMRADRQAHPDEPISAATFERIGKACRLSAATAKRRYYAAQKDPTLSLESPSMRVLAAAFITPHEAPRRPKPRR